MSAPEFELPPVVLPFEPPSLDSGVYAGGGATADAGVGYMVPAAAGADSVPTFVHYSFTMPFADYEFDPELASAIINLVPYMGEVKGVIEACLGVDLLTGEKLTDFQRLMNLASAIPMVGKLSRALKPADEIGHAVHKASGVGHRVEQAGEAAHFANRILHSGHLGEVVGERMDGDKKH